MIEKLRKENGLYADENGVSWNAISEYLQIEILGLCGCGNPDDIMEYIYSMLKRLEPDKDGNALYGEYEDMPYMFFIYWANEKGFAEHGNTVRCSWLTKNGKELIRDIEVIINKKEG